MRINSRNSDARMSGVSSTRVRAELDLSDLELSCVCAVARARFKGFFHIESCDAQNELSLIVKAA